MAAEWYYKTATNEEVGPFAPDDLKRLASEGRISSSTMVRKGMDGRWVPAKKVKGLVNGEPAKSTTTTTAAPLVRSTPPVLVSMEPEDVPEVYSPPVPGLPSKSRDVMHAEYSVVPPKKGLSPALLVGAGIGGTLLVVGIVALAMGFLGKSDKTNQPSVAQNSTAKDPSLNSGNPGNPIEEQPIKSQPPTQEQPKTNQPGMFMTPEDVVKAYLAAATWEERLLCVVNPDSVRPQMAAKYKTVDLAKTHDVLRPCTIYPVERQPTAVGERVIVKVNVSQGLPHHEYLRCVVVRTEEGFKVDWLETITLGDGDNERAAQNKLQLVEPVLAVEVLKVHQSSSAHTRVDIRVVNNSNKFISFWNVGADLHDADAKYLGHDNTNGSNLRPGQSVTGSIIFRDIQAADVSSWKLSLESVTIDLGGGNRQDVTKYFTLKEVR